MGPGIVDTQLGETQQALKTTILELEFERSTRAVEILGKDESIRLLREQECMWEDRYNALYTDLEQEQTRSDALADKSEALRAKLDESNEVVRRMSNESRTKTREIEAMKASKTMGAAKSSFIDCCTD